MDKITKLTELKKLLDDGLLTQEEFDKYKSELLIGKTENQKDESKVNERLKSENDNSQENTNQQKEKIIISSEEKKTENDYVQSLNSSQTNHSYGRYILGILLFVGFIGITSYNFYFKEKWSKESKENGHMDQLIHESSASDRGSNDSKTQTNYSNNSEVKMEKEEKVEIVDIQGIPFDEINPRIMYEPDPKALHPDWKDSELGGSSITFDAKKKIINSKGIFLCGDLISTRGEIIGGGPFYVVYSEWDFGTY